MNWKMGFQLLGLACLIFFADAFLKAYVHVTIPPMGGVFPLYPYEGIGVFRSFHGIEFSIVHVKNLGAILGAFAGFQTGLLYARLAIIGGLLGYLLFVKNSPLIQSALTLIIVGALGNVCDYFIYGHVVDMFYLVFWGFSYPVFNIADASICIGISLLFLSKLVGTRRGRAVSSAR